MSAPPVARPLWHYLLVAAAIAALAGAVELAMGRVPVSKSGHVRLWTTAVNSAENSQQVSDWYSFSHVIHGIALYGVFRLASRRRWRVGLCLVAAVAAEAAWE